MNHSDDDKGMTTPGPDLGAKARQTAHKLTQTGEEVLSEARDAVGGTLSDLKAEAGARVDDARRRLADEGERVAESLRETSARSKGDSLQARVLDGVASGLSSVSASLREADIPDIASRIRTFARHNPVLFATGAAVAGLVLARLLAGPIGQGERRAGESDRFAGGPMDDGTMAVPGGHGQRSGTSAGQNTGQDAGPNRGRNAGPNPNAGLNGAMAGQGTGSIRDGA